MDASTTRQRGAKVTVLMVTVLAMLAASWVLVGVGFAFAFGESAEPPSTATVPEWAKYVCWVVAGVIAIAAIPTGVLLSRTPQRRAR